MVAEAGVRSDEVRVWYALILCLVAQLLSLR